MIYIRVWRKLVGVIVTAAIVCGCIPFYVLAADNNTATLTIGSVHASPGETVSVPIILEQNISGGFAALEFGVKYSSGDLTLLSVKSGKDFELSIDSWI